VPSTPNPLYGRLNASKGFHTGYVSMLIGRRATDGHEPRQIWKEAAISDAVCVVDRSRSFTWRVSLERNSIGDAQPF